MDSQEDVAVLENGCIALYGNVLADGDNGLFQAVEDDGNGKGNLARDFLEDLEEYWDDINDRLMVSRMVSDSVIKGMVSAVEQEAAEKIAAKELEVVMLLQSFGEGGTQKGGNFSEQNCHRFSCVGHEQMREDVCSFKKLLEEKFDKAMKEVQCSGGCNSVKRIGSGSVIAGPGEILQDKQFENMMHISNTLESLKTTVGTICDKVDCVLVCSKRSLCQSLEERDLWADIEGMVMQSVLKIHQEEIEEKLWEHNAQFTGIQNINWSEKFNAISSLVIKLDEILKSLSPHETGLFSHGSHDLDILHHRQFGNHVVPSASPHEENGEVEGFTVVPESYDLQQLQHMTKAELVDFLNNRIMKMKREYESALHQKTEECFSLKREYMKEKGSFTKHRKDEEFDVLRKKIPEVISKVEDFLSENERFPVLNYSTENIDKLKDRVESLLSENRQLRECLADKQNELKDLETEVSGASAKLLQLSSSGKDMRQLLENLKSREEDARAEPEASLSEDIYKCFLRELFRHLRSSYEDSDTKTLMVQEMFEIIHREAASVPEATRKSELHNFNFDSLILQDLEALVHTEYIKNIGQRLKEARIYLEKSACDKDDELRLEVEEKEKIKQEMLGLQIAMEQKEKIMMDLLVASSKETEQFNVVYRELASVREDASQQQKVVDKITQEAELLRTQLTDAENQLEANKLEMYQLREKLEEAQEMLAEAENDKSIAFSRVQEMHDKYQFNESGGERLKIELRVAVSRILGLSEAFDDCECKILDAIKENSSRLDNANAQLKALRKTELLYQQKLERKCADLQMAEAEVDLLGDEVESLLRLLEKICIALDHYLPILKHYPGIVEILALVRRELSGDSNKS